MPNAVATPLSESSLYHGKNISFLSFQNMTLKNETNIFKNNYFSFQISSVLP